MDATLLLQYKDLWAEIFGDKAEFIESYFGIFVNEKSLHGISDENGIISALAACSYQWNYLESPINFAYLSGILTRPQSRGRGYCERLIKDTLKDLYKEGYALTGLIAADSHLVEYYSKFGFVRLPDKEEEIFHRINADGRLIDSYFLINGADITSDNYKWFVSHRNNAVRHTKQSLKLYNSAEYERFAVTYGGTVRAFAVGVKSKYFIELVDLHFVNNEGKIALLSLLCKTFKRDVKILAKKNRMLRIVNAKKIISLYAEKHFDKNFTLHVCDDIVTENNITLTSQNGRITDTDNSYKVPFLRIEDLTAKTFPCGDLFLMYEI